jgi:hypothetical protein
LGFSWTTKVQEENVYNLNFEYIFASSPGVLIESAEIIPIKPDAGNAAGGNYFWKWTLQSFLIVND